MSKLTTILSVGSCYSPWFPWLLASCYFTDEIIVYNGGYDLKNPKKTEYNIPLKQVSRDISELDPAGKVYEFTGWTHADEKTHKFTLGTQSTTGGDQWYNVNGLATTLANQTACDRGATWILRCDGDQVLYEDARRLKGDMADKDWQLYQYEFAHDINHLRVPPPDSPYNDSAFTHIANHDDYYGGSGCPHIISGRVCTDQMHVAHLRAANPLESTPEERLRHFRERNIMQLFFNCYPDFTPELFTRAEEGALNLFNDPGVNYKPSDVQPPQVTLRRRKELPEYVRSS